MEMQVLILGLIFLAVSGLAFGVTAWLNRRSAIQQRLDQIERIATGPESDLVASPGSVWQARVAKVAEPIARLAAPKEGWTDSNLRVRFIQAGLRDPSWPVLYFSAKVILALALPGLYLFVQGLRSTPSGLTNNLQLLLPLLLAAVGYYVPNMVLSYIRQVRNRELTEALPDALDLMIVCVEAGLGLDAAMNRAASELGLRSKELADELNLVALELRAGVKRELAMQNLAIRTGVDDIAAFVTMIVQSDRFGTNVAEALRVQADTMRVQRQLRAEEAAAKIPLKLLFPLIFFIFPSLLVVLMGPAMIAIHKILLPTLAGGN